MNPKSFLKQNLYGFSQIMLQKNQLTGLFFLIGIFLENWMCAIAAIAASVVGNLTARILKFDMSHLDDGLYSFSPILVGVALFLIFGHSTWAWAMLIIGSTLAAILQNIFLVKKMPGYTFPFIFVTWILFIILHHLLQIPVAEVSTPLTHPPYAILLTGLHAFGEVIFQGHILSGVLFFIGVFISNKTAALYALLAGYLGALIAFYFHLPDQEILLGLFGFSAVLTAIVFSSEIKNRFMLVLFGSILTIAIHIFLVQTNALYFLGGVFTFPFVLGTWLTLMFNSLLKRRSLFLQK